MKIERVTYQKVFPLGQYVNEKIGVDYLLQENDDPKAALQAAKDLCEEFHRESNNFPMPFQTETSIPATIPDIQITKEEPKSLEDQIKDCFTKNQLQEFRLIARMNPKLQEVYDNRWHVLSKLDNAQI